MSLAYRSCRLYIPTGKNPFHGLTMARLASNNYWSSSEYDSNNAWNVNFNNGNVNNNNKDNNNRVRFVRVIQVSTLYPSYRFPHLNLTMNKSDVDMAELYRAYRSCRRRKRHTRQEQEFSIHISSNLPGLRNDLLYGTYRPLPVRSFLIDKPVLREIFAPDFRDRIDQHFIAEKLEPLFERHFILDCYSCRKGKGTLFGIRRLRRFIAQCSANYTRDCYILLCDLKGYFMSIDRHVLWRNLEDFIRRNYQGDDLEKLLWQTKVFLHSSPLDHTVIRGRRSRWAELPDNKSVFACCGAPKPDAFRGTYTADMDIRRMGLTIGALPSQMFGNFHLTPFDHFCKHDLGLRFYGRYVDDFFVVHEDRCFLRWLVPVLREYLRSMGLTLHPDKVRILHYRQGVPFLGVYVKGPLLLPGRRIRGAFRGLLHDIDSLGADAGCTPDILRYESRLNSYLGMFRHLHAHRYVSTLLGRHPGIRRNFRTDSSLHKAVSTYRIRSLQHRRACSQAARDYHSQFRRSCRSGFRSRAALYRLAYFGLYGVFPVCHGTQYRTSPWVW